MVNSIKTFLIAMVPAFMLVSCQQEVAAPDMGEECRKVELDLGFSLSANLTTRAARPLTSIDSWQHVNDMRVYVFHSESGEEGSFYLYHPYMKDESTGNITKQTDIYVPAFEKHDDYIWNVTDDEEHTYRTAAFLPDGYFRLLAVGSDTPNKSSIKLDWKEGLTEWNSAVLTNTGNTPCVNEIFTGYPRDDKGNVATFLVKNKNNRFSASIECRRAVAGVLLYLKNIPSHYKAEFGWTGDGGGTGIIITDLKKDDDLKIYEVAIVSVGYNPVCEAVKRRWSLSSKTDELPMGDFKYDESRFKLTRIASVVLNPDEAGENGYHNRTFPAVGNFVLPANTYSVKDNPLTADYPGGMTNPSEKSFDKSLYLCFFTKTGTGNYYPLKLWPIKLVRSYTQDYDQEDECAGDLGLTEDDPYHYNLVANHLYCLGMYKDDKSIDEPVDLKKEIDEHPHDDLTITVIGSWQWDVNIEM